MMKTLLVIATMCYVCGVEARTFGDILTEDDLRLYVRGNHEVEEFDIIDPFVSGGRSKRSTLSESILLTSRLQLSAFKEDFHLELFENPWLVPSDLKIKHIYGSKVHEEPFNGKRCHFHGRSMNHNNSVAVISTCAGVHGVITVGDTEVYVEPLKKDHISRLSLNVTNELEQPHIVYKKRLKNESYGFCGATKDLRHEKKRKKKAIDGIDFEYYVGPKFMEIKLVLDHSFVDEHFPDASEYALALMNIASRRFVDSSLGFPIHLYIVSIVELHYPEPFVVYSRLYDTLVSFINWLTETRINNDDDPDHWDHGILLSGHYYDKELDPAIGYGTRLPPMCFPHPNRTSCNVVTDLGLGTGFVIVHEIGHSLGLEHDDAEGVGCGTHYIMAHAENEEQSAFRWSSCSRKSLNKLWRGKPGCLDDIPDDEVREVSINEVSPDQPSINVQCREFITKLLPQYATYERYIFSCEEKITCTSLYCKVDTFENGYDGDCFAVGEPPAEGTSCGLNHYCINGECVSNDGDVSSLGASDGKFSEWETSPCSRSCGGGIIVTRRTCSNPRQAFAGAFCDGQHLHYELCNIQPCEETKTFLEEREDICAEIDPKLGFRAFLGDQVPSSCIKACWNYTSSTWAYHEPIYFEDGIKCWNDIFKDDFTVERRCVAGKCVQFNCYGDEGNEGLYDLCRICGGNGSSCYPHSEVVNKNEKKQDIVLPENATSILVVNYDCETDEGRRALDVQSGADVYVFEGNIFKVGFDYLHGTKCAVNLTSTGPLTVDFLLPLEHRSDIGNQKLFTVEYYLPKSSPTFLWRPGPFSLCSVNCGRGTSTREVKCIKILDGEERQVEEDLCDVLGKPMTTLSCSIPCWSFTFSPCQNDRTRNVLTKVRSAECKIGEEVVVSSECNQATKPVNIHVPCSDDREYEWTVGPWSQCYNCQRTRDVNCVVEPYELPATDEMCNYAEKPTQYERCTTSSCVGEVTTHSQKITYRWSTGPWSTCLTECEQTREVHCTADQSGEAVLYKMCDPLIRPSRTRECEDCEEWISEAWGECSATCGTGSQTRYVYCFSGEYVRCYKNMPPETKDCYNPICDEGGSLTSSSRDGIIALFVVVALVVGLCGIIGFYVRRKKKNQTAHMSRLRDHNTAEASVNLGQISTSSGVSINTFSAFRDNDGIVHQIRITDLPNCFKKMNCNPEETLVDELMKLAPPQEHSIDETHFRNTNENQESTEHHQDEITTEPENLSPCYIKDKEKVAFIVTQGPCPSTLEAFWKLIWQEKVPIIVDLNEQKDAFTALSALQSSEQSIRCGEFSFTLLRRNERPEYALKEVTVVKGSGIRHISICQFHSWPENGIPQQPESLIGLIKKLKSLYQGHSAPLLVHCNKDFRSSAAFATIFCLVDLLKDKQCMNVKNFVANLTMAQKDMFPNQSQYNFIYEALAAASTFPPVDLEPHTLLGLDLNGNKHRGKMMRDYQALKHQQTFGAPAISEEGCKPNNAAKNRYPDILPLDPYRPVWKFTDNENALNYINATLVNSFWSDDGIIMTQSPLPNTIEDFWSTVYSYKCAAVISLNNFSKRNENVPPYWLDGFTVKYGKISTGCSRLQYVKRGVFVKRKMCIRREGYNTPLNVDHFEFLDWPTSNNNVSGFLDIIAVIQPMLKTKKRIVLHCLDGAGRCGVMAAISTELGRVKEDGVIDLFQTVLKLRRRSPGSIKCQEEYNFCYTLLQAALKTWRREF